MPTKPISEPTDRSMLRETMTSTMPVAITATEDGLHRQVPEIARRQEDAAGEDIEADPDNREGGDHAEQARIDLRHADEIGHRRQRGSSGALRRSTGNFSHSLASPSGA